MITKTRVECISNISEWMQCLESGLHEMRDNLNPMKIQFLTDAQLRELESCLSASKHHLWNATEIFNIVRDNAQNAIHPRPEYTKSGKRIPSVIPCNPNND